MLKTRFPNGPPETRIIGRNLEKHRFATYGDEFIWDCENFNTIVKVLDDLLFSEQLNRPGIRSVAHVWLINPIRTYRGLDKRSKKITGGSVVRMPKH